MYFFFCFINFFFLFYFGLIFKNKKTLIFNPRFSISDFFKKSVGFSQSAKAIFGYPCRTNVKTTLYKINFRTLPAQDITLPEVFSLLRYLKE